MNRRALTVCALPLLGIGCQPPPIDMAAAVAHIRGSMNGYRLEVARSVFAVVGDSSFSIYLADRADFCTVLQRGASARNMSFFRLGTVADAPQRFPLGAYTYPSGPGSGAGDGSGLGQGGAPTNGRGPRKAVIATSDGRCYLSGYNQAAEGQFEIVNSVDTNTKMVYGAFDVLFEVGYLSGEFSGNFVAPICPYATEIPFDVPGYCED